MNSASFILKKVFSKANNSIYKATHLKWFFQSTKESFNHISPSLKLTEWPQSDLMASLQSGKQTWAQRFVPHGRWRWGGRVWAAAVRLLWEWDSAALRTLIAPNLHLSTNTQTKMLLCGLSPAPSISANRHCLCFPPAVYFQNDYCTAHTIC